MWTLEQKQNYFKEQVPEEQRENFWAFLDDEVGNYDVEKWSNQFIVQLVNKFKQQKKDHHETSFYVYQTKGKGEQAIDTKNILSGLSSQTQQIFHKMPKQAPKTDRISPFEFLDSIFNKKGKEQFPIVNQPDPQHFKTCNPIVEKVESPPANSFSTNQFWEMGTKGHKISKSNVNFASFDFWSQPNSANNSPKSKKPDFDSLSEKGLKKEEPNRNALIPSFAELMGKCGNENGPSPYTKKSNVDEVVVGEQKIISEKIRQPSPKLDTKSTKSVKKLEKQAAKPGKVLYDGEVVLKSQFQSEVKCFTATERVKIKNPELRAVIKGHEIIQRTFLMPDYAMYSIQVIPLDIVINRNYEDFSRLRATLGKLFPGTKLAYLPKNSWFSSTSLEFIKNQKVMLQFFLNDLIKNPEIRNSRILEDFLTLPNHKTIKRKFEEWEQLEAPKSIEELCWLNGKIQINLSEQQRLYQENFKRYHSKMLGFLDRQGRLIETLLEQYKDIDFTQGELINLVKSMIDQTAYFNERVYGLQFQEMASSLKVLYNSYCQENKVTKFNINTISDMIKPFVNYEKENISEIQQLIDTQQKFFKSYLRRSVMQKSEDMPYTSDKLKPYKEGVLQESKSILVLKYQAGFLSNQLCSEGYRVIQTLARKYVDLFKDYSEKCRVKCGEMAEFWKETSSFKQLVLV